MNDARIVGHDVEEVPRLLQRADDRVVRALQDSDDAALGRARCRLSRARSCSSRVMRCDDAVAMHRGAGVFCSNEEILLAGFSRCDRNAYPA
ncbi:MAG: hypothetical protein WKF47_06440 [Geodermatophilaceae bacterium]